MRTQVDIKYLAKMARVGDDDHRCLINTITTLRNEIHEVDFLAVSLERRVHQLEKENRFLVQQLQEDL